jgi:hypothetical protein
LSSLEQRDKLISAQWHRRIERARYEAELAERRYEEVDPSNRLIAKVPHGNWKTTTFICGLRHDRVTAPFTLDGAMDGPHFSAYVEQILAPTLKKGDIVFMDNVSTHLVDGVEEAIEARGASVSPGGASPSPGGFSRSA